MSREESSKEQKQSSKVVQSPGMEEKSEKKEKIDSGAGKSGGRKRKLIPVAPHCKIEAKRLKLGFVDKETPETSTTSHASVSKVRKLTTPVKSKKTTPVTSSKVTKSSPKKGGKIASPHKPTTHVLSGTPKKYSTPKKTFPGNTSSKTATTPSPKRRLVSILSVLPNDLHISKIIILN